MTTTESQIVVGVFRDSTLAKQAIDELRHLGLRDDQIRLAGQANSDGGLLHHLVGTLSRQEAAHQSLPAELVSKGVPEEEALYYQQELDAGHAVVLVESYGHQQEAHNIMHRYGAYDASNRSSQSEADRIIPVREEELRVQKQVVLTGEVIIRKQIITEDKTFTVPVTREELIIERRPVSDQLSDQPANEGETLDDVLKGEETLRIVLREEQVRIEKYTIVKEEIFISKRQIQETRYISDTLKREEAYIERIGNVNIQGPDGDSVSG